MSDAILKAHPEQFTIDDLGQILFQEKVGSPLPGQPVAKLAKGDDLLSPILVFEGDAAVKIHLETWLKSHIETVLAPLVGLRDEALVDAPKVVADAVLNACGTVARSDIQAQIADLGEEGRAVTRSKKIRLGPLLVFQPELNKPAPIRLRSVLWSLFNGKPLPAPVPKDGVVSYALEGEDYDTAYFQMIGYPVYCGRAIRIDMLDRVINAVYEAADKGRFQAQHQMAEWLGCSIEDLYKVLEALGHTRQIEEGVADETQDDTQAVEEAPVAEVEGSTAADTQSQAQSETSDKATDEKPPLAFFRLKKGAANASGRTGGGAKGAKPFKKKDKKPKGKRNKSTNRAPKVMSAEAKPADDDNPFAVLQQLKK